MKRSTPTSRIVATARSVPPFPRGLNRVRTGTRVPEIVQKETRMPQEAWSEKRERQYEHIVESEKEQGASTKRAKEIAARTVNKERARHGETKGRASRTST